MNPPYASIVLFAKRELFLCRQTVYSNIETLYLIWRDQYDQTIN
jgi:hypothetical protein